MRKSKAEKDATHETLIAQAARLLRHRGSDGLSVADIMAAAGMTVGGFYRHFESKEACLAEAIRYAAHQTQSILQPLIDKTRGDLSALVEAYLSPDHVVHPETGCVVAALFSESHRSQGAARAAFVYAMDGLATMVAQCLPAAKSSRAAAIVALMAGGLALARARTTEPTGYLTELRAAVLALADAS